MQGIVVPTQNFSTNIYSLAHLKVPRPHSKSFPYSPKIIRIGVVRFNTEG